MLSASLVMIFAPALIGSGNQPAYASCIQDEDWPNKPCLDTPPYSEEYRKQVWQQYYEYKGAEWMEAKKVEMDGAIENGTLRQWVETRSSPTNFANHNVWYYYYLNGEAPDAYAETGPESPSQGRQQMCQELGISEQECTDAAIVQKRGGHDLLLSDEEQRRIEENQRQIDNSMYMIGIGAAIAGVIAFITLRKRN
jgi:uncharacterized protein with von Willebrand factor type A (vWA) domain